jgi:hypothetical protein
MIGIRILIFCWRREWHCLHPLVFWETHRGML